MVLNPKAKQKCEKYVLIYCHCPVRIEEMPSKTIETLNNLTDCLTEMDSSFFINLHKYTISKPDNFTCFDFISGEFSANVNQMLCLVVLVSCATPVVRVHSVEKNSNRLTIYGNSCLATVLLKIFCD
jgi:hypothetical protein